MDSFYDSLTCMRPFAQYCISKFSAFAQVLISTNTTCRTSTTFKIWGCYSMAWHEVLEHLHKMKISHPPLGYEMLHKHCNNGSSLQSWNNAASGRDDWTVHYHTRSGGSCITSLYSCHPHLTYNTRLPLEDGFAVQFVPDITISWSRARRGSKWRIAAFV